MKKFKCKNFEYSNDLVDFLNKNKIQQKQIVAIVPKNDLQVLYWWEEV